MAHGLFVMTRRAQAEDRAAIWRVHTTSIRELAKSHYGSSDIEAWAGRLVPDGYLDPIATQEFVVAEMHRRVVGFGQLNVETAEIEALYVHPDAARRGVGTALLRALEERARQAGLTSVHLDASLNAVPFYARFGFTAVREARHSFASGAGIACMVMEKGLS